MSVWDSRLEARVATTLRLLPIRRGTGTVALGAVAKFASGAGQSFFVAVFVEHLITGAHVSRSSFAILYALATVVSAAITLTIGRVVDRAGVGPVWIGVATGLATACLGLSLATSPLMVLPSLCLLRGFGQGSFPLLGTILVARRFDARRGRALSISALGLTASGFLMPLLGTGLISAFGWRSALQLVGAGLVVLVLPLGLLAGRRREQPSAGAVPQASAGAVPQASAGAVPQSSAGAVPQSSAGAVPQASAGAAPEVSAGPAPEASAGPARKRFGRPRLDPGVPMLLAILAVPPLVSTALIVYGVSLLARGGLSPAAAAAAISASAAAGAVGNVIGGQLTDRFSPRVLLAAMGTTLSLAVLLLLSGRPLLSLAAMIVLGLAGGMSYTANATVWAGAYGTRRIGRVQGLANAGQVTGAAIGPLPLALLLSLTGSYVPGLVVLCALALAAALAGSRWRPPGERPETPRAHAAPAPSEV